MTDHKALVSLLNGINKKNKTMLSRLTPWLDRLIPFDFQVNINPEQKSASQITCQEAHARKQIQLDQRIACLRLRK